MPAKNGACELQALVRVRFAMEERVLVDQQLCSGNLPHSLVDCGRVGILIVVAQDRQPDLRAPSAGRV